MQYTIKKAKLDWLGLEADIIGFKDLASASAYIVSEKIPAHEGIIPSTIEIVEEEGPLKGFPRI